MGLRPVIPCQASSQYGLKARSLGPGHCRSWPVADSPCRGKHLRGEVLGVWHLRGDPGGIVHPSAQVEVIVGILRWFVGLPVPIGLTAVGSLAIRACK